jgi:hypothetical protein
MISPLVLSALVPALHEPKESDGNGLRIVSDRL